MATPELSPISSVRLKMMPMVSFNIRTGTTPLTIKKVYGQTLAPASQS